MTHDSIGLGEDGPTHQPVEHVASLRLLPNLDVWRPCDALETLVAWRSALNPTTPTVLALSRQNLPLQPRTAEQIANVSKGGYVLQEAENAQVTLIATGSEVELAADSAKKLAEEGIVARVVSMPCVERFQAQSSEYQQSVLPQGQAKVAIEAGVSALWQGIVGDRGAVIGVDSFGASAPAEQLFAEFGFTVDNVVAKVKELAIIS